MRKTADINRTCEGYFTNENAGRKIDAYFGALDKSYYMNCIPMLEDCLNKCIALDRIYVRGKKLIFYQKKSFFIC